MPSAANALQFSRENSCVSTPREVGSSHHRPGLDWLAPVSEVNQLSQLSHEALLVGGSDRYSIGNLLRPHVITRLLNFKKFRCSGLVSGDFSSVGGHSVRNFGESALEMGGSNLQLLHFGGESLATPLIDAYSAAITDEEEERFESLREIGSDEEMVRYAKRRSGQVDDLAYVLAPEGEFYGASTSFHSVGLSDPEALTDSSRKQLLENLQRAAFVGVRDEVGADFLEKEGVAVERMPCGLSVLPQVCARQLREHRDCKALEDVRRRFPNGWISVEVSRVRQADFEKLSEALREVSEREGLGLVFFSASDAMTREVRAWVDEYREWNAAAFGSDQIWDIASLLLHSRLYCGTSLSCRIIAMSAGVSRINIPTGDAAASSYCELWEHDSVPILFCDEEDWGIALNEALGVDLSSLQEHAKWTHTAYFSAFEKFCTATGMSPRMIPAQSETKHVRAVAAMHHLHDEWLSDPDSEQLFRRLSGRKRKTVGARLGFGRVSAKRKSHA